MLAKLLAVGVLATNVVSFPALAQSPKDTLTIDLPGDPATLDPHLQWDTDSYSIYRNIFDNLLTRDENGEITPFIATSWKYTDDTTVEFDIRDGVKFHDGSPLTAEDVVFSIKRIIDPKFKSPQLSQFDQIIGCDRRKSDQGAHHDEEALPGAALPVGEAVDRAVRLR